MPPMSPSLEEAPKAAASATPHSIVKARYRWDRWRGVLLSACICLGLSIALLWTLHPSAKPPEKWTLLRAVWICGIVATVVSAWVCRRLAPTSWMSTAKNLDRQLGSQNRLEMSALWDASGTPLAEAQRSEAAAFLSGLPPRRRPERLLVPLASAAAVLALAHLATLVLWVVVPLLPRLQSAGQLGTPDQLPSASITWVTPEPEYTANPIEEVPAEARVQSTTGLSALSLELSVNGAPRKSVPLPEKPYDNAGENPLKTSLFMDELDVAPYDVVSYYIRGQRIFPTAIPDTTSPIQFVQVRPYRDDVKQAAPQKPMPGGDLLVLLKLAELRSIKENFLLAHTDLPVTNPVRSRENKRVGENQAALALKTDEVVQALVKNGAPTEIVDLLLQAEPPMGEAAKKILADRNAEALPEQEQALNLIVEVEKYFQKILAPPDAAQAANPPDPFKDRQRHELPPRPSTPAGKMEDLAKEQDKVSRELSPQGGQGAIRPPIYAGVHSEAQGDAGSHEAPDSPAERAERQARIKGGIEDLLKQPGAMGADTRQALQDAEKAATEAALDLGKGDSASATGPAAQAAASLHKAVAGSGKAGDDEAARDMGDAQRSMKGLANDLRGLGPTSSPDGRSRLQEMAARAAHIQGQLDEAADREQNSGSAQGAQRLKDLANAMDQQGIARDIARLGDSASPQEDAAAIGEKLDSLAKMASRQQAMGQRKGVDVSLARDELTSTLANLSRIAEKPGDPGSVLNPKDEAAYHDVVDSLERDITGPDGLLTRGLARDLYEKMDVARQMGLFKSKPTWGDVELLVRDIGPPMKVLISRLAEAEVVTRRDELIGQPGLDDAPLEYRQAVSDYFEIMSDTYSADGVTQVPAKP
jgi:hypothetical protein